MHPYAIRIVGDPVLRQRANEVTDIDGKLAAIVDGMTGALYEAHGLAVAAPQVGVLKRLFVYQLPDEEERRPSPAREVRTSARPQPVKGLHEEPPCNERRGNRNHRRSLPAPAK